MFSPTSASHNHSTARMRDAVAALSITQRQALYLTVVEDMPATAVARRLDMPCDLVEQIASAARTHLYEAVAA
jgi:DNA-directed RNA polymerase specialized sigma24 family protein